MPVHIRMTTALLVGILPSIFCITSVQAQEAREIAAAHNAIGHLQALGQRGAKQYLMFQFRIGNTVSKAPLQRTVDEFDRTLGALQIGNRLERIPTPPNPAVREQIDKLREDWAVLRKIYTYDPVALRREPNLIPFEEQRQDPILVRYVDRLTAELQTDIEALGARYEEACQEAGHATCDLGVRAAGRQRMLSEAIVKDILMVVLNIAPDKNKQRLQSNTRLFESTLQEMTGGPSTEGGASLGQTVLQTIEGYWQQLKIDVDLAVRAKPGDIDINRLLSVQRELVEELDSYAVMSVASMRSGQ